MTSPAVLATVNTPPQTPSSASFQTEPNPLASGKKIRTLHKKKSSNDLRDEFYQAEASSRFHQRGGSDVSQISQA
ncbi:hypothetical protein K435DRAFT_782243 [Dendrothele bispora CBS 962.96]|uniref:Uncharacterized protein n=1 Tax=Dendrothele bispora (strain CBS 962.96) TaxID=1314807 RepID=A0A4S8LG60_DENBC|nr:hypothetical protein K435DRAFT_782243 [Dendrothele bispora CBS 962.96]